MAKLIITVEGGTITQTLNFLDRNIKDNRYVYGNGNESGIMENPEEIYADIPQCERVAELYRELLDAVGLSKSRITNIMRQLNELEQEMDSYVIPVPENKQEHVITLDNKDLEKLADILNVKKKFASDKSIRDAIRALIHIN